MHLIGKRSINSSHKVRGHSVEHLTISCWMRLKIHVQWNTMHAVAFINTYKWVKAWSLLKCVSSIPEWPGMRIRMASHQLLAWVTLHMRYYHDRIRSLHWELGISEAWQHVPLFHSLKSLRLLVVLPPDFFLKVDFRKCMTTGWISPSFSMSASWSWENFLPSTLFFRQAFTTAGSSFSWWRNSAIFLLEKW